MQPLISVIVPTYNRCDTIKQSVDSVLNQNYYNIELIIVDDGSTDNTKDIISGYNDERIKYIYNYSDRHGAGTARNIGISYATGEYIAFNDSDDEWEQGKLISQYNFLIKENVEITFCLMELNGMVMPSRFSEKKCNLEYILRGNIPGPQAMFGKAECFKCIRFDESMRSFEDNEWLIRLFDNYKISFQDKIYVHMSASEGSVSSNYERNITMLNYLMDKHSSLYDKYPLSKKAVAVEIEYIKALADDSRAFKELKCDVTIEGVVKVLTNRLKRYVYALRMLKYR